jgi:hypothetical protein
LKKRDLRSDIHLETQRRRVSSAAAMSGINCRSSQFITQGMAKQWPARA